MIDTTPGRVLYIEDDELVRRSGVQSLQLAGFDATGFANAEAALPLVDAEFAGVVVSDIRLPGMSGLDLLKRFAEESITLPAIMITGESDVAVAVASMKGGAVDFIAKPIRPDDLLDSIGRALTLAGGVADRDASRIAARRLISALTTRQREIMDLVLAGHPNKNIAADLNISQRTVENHRASIMHKTGSKSLPALVRVVLMAADA